MPSRHVRFAIVKRVGLSLPGVEAAIRYDGSPVLRLGGCFLAGLAAHPSAEAGTLVVRCEIDDREALLNDAPDTYYVTDYYRPYPIVLVRLQHVDRDSLHDLLSISWHLTRGKAGPRSAAPDHRSRHRRRGQTERH